MRINIFKKFKKLLYIDLEVVNETICLDNMLSRLQKEANNHNIFMAEWSKSDSIFSICPIQNLKVKGIKVLKTLEIVLTEPTEIITDESDKLKLMQIYHNDPIKVIESYLVIYGIED